MGTFDFSPSQHVPFRPNPCPVYAQVAFIEPDAPEFAAGSMEEWKQMGPRIVTLSPFTIAQNSLHGPVTPLVPESICQTLRTDVIVSETSAQDIEPDWEKEY